MSGEILRFLPQQWVGMFAVVMFSAYIVMQFVEKYPTIAKIVPLGRWWHDRQKNRRGQRRDWVAEDNEVIQGLQAQISSLASDLAKVNERVRTFTAWSGYDARWHHLVAVTNAASPTCMLPEHLDYFAFEKLWDRDPVAAARL